MPGTIWSIQNADGAGSFREPLGQTKVMQIRQGETQSEPVGNNSWILLFSSSIVIIYSQAEKGWKLSKNLFTMRWKKFVKRKVLCQSLGYRKSIQSWVAFLQTCKIVRKSWIGRGAYCARVRSRFDGKIYCPSSHYSFPILRSETRRARRSLENGELVIKNFLSF